MTLPGYTPGAPRATKVRNSFNGRDNQYVETVVKEACNGGISLLTDHARQLGFTQNGRRFIGSFLNHFFHLDTEWSFFRLLD